jgi:hypothetical protein
MFSTTPHKKQISPPPATSPTARFLLIRNEDTTAKHASGQYCDGMRVKIKAR